VSANKFESARQRYIKLYPANLFSRYLINTRKATYVKHNI